LLKWLFYGIAWLLAFALSAKYWQWFGTGLSSHFDLLSAFLLALILFFWVKEGNGFQLKRLIFNPWAFSLSLLSMVLLLVVKNQSTINIFGFFLSLTMAYGLLGALINPANWRAGLVPFGLLLMTLPFGRHLDVFIGYPLRVASVNAAFYSLKPLLPNLSTLSSLLVIENQASHVDMDCSGLKGLWVATLLYFLITWLENARIGLRWFLGLALLWLYLMLGNFLRVVVLSLIHLYLKNPALDPWVHHSLAIFFLLSAAGLAYYFLRYLRTKSNLAVADAPKASYPQKIVVPYALLSALMLIGLWVPAFAKTPSSQGSIKVVEKIVETGWHSTELSAPEKRVFGKEGVMGHKFTKGDNQLIVVFNGDWRSQHKPELCYELTGNELSSIKTTFIKPQFPIRVMHFKNRPEKAFYWFQTGALVTDDLAQKVWQQVSGRQQTWTQVSMLNQNGDLPQKEIQIIYSILKTYSHD
jgi:exosortase O